MPRPPRTVSVNLTPGSAASSARVICQGNVAPGAALVGSPVAELTEPTVVAEPTASTATGPPAAMAVASCPSGAPVVVNSSGAPQTSPVSLPAQDGSRQRKDGTGEQTGRPTGAFRFIRYQSSRPPAS